MPVAVFDSCLDGSDLLPHFNLTRSAIFATGGGTWAVDNNSYGFTGVTKSVIQFLNHYSFWSSNTGTIYNNYWTVSFFRDYIHCICLH